MNKAEAEAKHESVDWTTDWSQGWNDAIDAVLEQISFRRLGTTWDEAKILDRLAQEIRSELL